MNNLVIGVVLVLVAVGLVFIGRPNRPGSTLAFCNLKRRSFCILQ